ncbi:mucin-17-like isoform X2 [Saccostrea echinata]|uniref:mucin-17-like isoform X2 n=1 Tax=Saccostrea echinata TaxID=191078 RepID=UPI002A7ED9E4|nr:mucin-17-like isoform X2 [Saccostrea echinata]
MTDKFGLGSGHEARQTMNGDIDDGHAPLFISTEEESTVSKRNKTVHNSTEKKRKEQIRYWIQQIGEQLPPLVTTKSEKERHGRSTLEIVEKACTYIKELKGKIGHDDELQKVSMELENMRAERDRLQEILKMAGYAATQEVPPQGTSVPVSEAAAEQEKKKTKKRNTINLQLELKKQQAAAAQQQQQENQQQQNAALATGAAGMQDVLAQGIVGNPMTNFPNMMIGGAGQQLINQQMFMNSMMFGVPPAGGSQMPMGGNPCMQAQTHFTQGLPGQSMTGQQSDKNAAEAGAGLLQLAMQDAGITPSSNNNPSQTEDSVSTSSSVQRSSAPDQSTVSSALHTLASVASNTQNVTNISQIPASQVQSNASMIQTGATTTTTQSVNSVAPIMATGQQNLNGTNNVMNMPFVNGQQQMATNVMPGNQIVNPGTSNAMQQIMFINEQGVPCIANVPVGIDPASLGLPNMGKQIVGGNLLIQKDDQQTVLANNLAQQQMNLAMQGIQQQPFQQGQTNVTMGGNNIVQQPVNNQLALNQHIMQPMQGPIQGLSNPQNPQGLILPASQTGNLLTVNSVPNFSNPQSQLPQALLLPNGQIIPVVSNPNLFAPGQAPANQLITPGGQPNAIQGTGIPQRLPVPQNIVQPDGSQMLVTSTGQIQVAPQNMNIQGQATVQQGLLMTTNSILPQVSPSTSSTASGTTSLVSTSVITSTVTSTSGVTVNRKPKTSSSATTSAEEVILTQNQANLVQTGMDSSTPVTSQVMTSDPNSASMKILNPQLQSVLHGQLGGSTAPILLTMNCNGQPTSILVDPTTMQVLGTVQTQQPPQQPNLNPTTSVSTSTPSKKNKKNGQRAICPKPQVANTSSAITTVTSVMNPIVGPTVTLPTQANPSIAAGVWNSDKESMEVLPPPSAPTSKKSSSKSKSKSKSNKGNTETQLEAQGKTDSGEMGEQDILAKAAESIFSEISPVNFYNPANEDNPLQIDTSVCEGEDEGKESESPKKDANKGKVSSAGATDNSSVLDSEMIESNTDDVKNKNKKDFSDSLKEQSSDENDILTNILKAAESNEQEKASETGNNNSNNQVGETLFDIVSNTAVETAKKSKKSKKSKLGNNTAEISDSSSKDSPALISLEDKLSTQSSKKSSKKSKKSEQENSLKESVVEQESLMSMPEEITFCENDIEDVLNQVEKMGNSFGSPTSSVGKKSSKSKKDRSENVDSEPANKRRKRNVSKEKSKEAGEPSLQASTAAKPSMSVYDFDEDTDFSTPLFPLHSSRNLSGGPNTKNQTASSSSDKTPTSSSSPLFSMPVITTEPGSSTTPLFDDFPMTPKKRGKHKKNKKVEEKISDVSVSKKADNDLLNSHNSLDRLGSESRTDSDKNTTSDVTKKSSENCLEKMDVQYSSKDNGFLSKSDTRQHSVNFPSEQSNNKNSSSISFESQGNTEQPMSITTQNMDSNRQDRSEGNLNTRRPTASRSNVDQMSVDTNPLTVDTNDIESTVNNLLGLSPHMLSPSNMRHKQVQQSPQLQTPKSNSPASMKSPMTSPAIAYQQQTHMPNDHMARPSASSSISTNPDLTYSAESLFSSQSKHLDSSRGIDTNSSQLPQTTRMSGNTDSMMKSTEESTSAARPKSIYSADNFVHSAKNDKSSKSAPNVISPSMSTSLSRGQNENSSDGFNFNNIGLNLSTPTTSTNSFMDSLTMSPIISTVANTTSSSTPFTFTLSSNSSTHTTSTASMMQSPASQSQNSSHQGNHNFPFYSPHQSPQRPPSHHQRPPTTSASPQHTNSAPSNISSNQSQRPPVNNLSNFDLNLPPSNSQMPSSQSSQRRSSHEHDARMSQHMPAMADSQYSYGMSRNCSVQDQRQREQTTMPREEPPSFPNITVTTHEGPLNMGMSKSNPHKRMNDIGQGSMSSKSTSDSRSDRTSGGGYSMNSSMQPFFPPPNFSNSSSNPLETPPLHHPPMLGSDNRGSMGVRGFNPVFSSSQSYNPVQQSFGGNRYESNNVPPFSQRDSSGTQPLSHTPPNQVMDGRKSANTPSSQTAKSNKQPSQPMQGSQTNRTMNGPPSHRSGPTPPQAQPQTSHRPTPQQQLSQPQSQQSRSKSSSSSSRSSSSKQSQKKKQNYVEMESGIPPHPAMFEANRMTPLFPLPQARSPPFPANLFGSGPHQGASMSKNSELSSPFNQLFPPARPQNGLGFQFNNFGMNSVHSAMSNSPQITPHSGSVTVTPHMSNFTFTNIFSDVNNSSQNDALNISPIKFPHPNPMLPHQGMDPNSLHHPHQQGSSIYHHHNRAHPSSVIHNAMNINSILGHNHHSFDSRGMSQGMNTSVAPPFPGHGHPPGFGMPPLNFSMHDT